MSIYTIDDFDTYKQDYTVSLADKLEYGEIYTPFALIRQMLALLDPAVFLDPTKTWLDVGAGQGYFTMLLFDRLNKGLKARMPDDQTRKTHIVENMLYLVELKESNVSALRHMFGPKANIIHADFSTQTAAKKYDYIIGNPPYNSQGMKKVPTNTQRDKKQDGTTLWVHLLKHALTLLTPTTGQLCMIVPSLWLKPDKSQMHHRLTHYQIEKIHCFSSTETNTIFKGAAQTPTCFFLLTNTAAALPKSINLYDTKRQAYVPYPYQTGQAIPVFGAHIIKKIQPWLAVAGALAVVKTNMPSKHSRFTELPYSSEVYPYTNITTCVLEGLQPALLLNYSNTPQAFHGIKKLVLAHKMYGFPYWDRHGHYGIANRDNYVITGKTDSAFEQLAAFLSTKFALYLFEAARYRMKYLEKYAFEFVPDITRLPDFPSSQAISDETVADFFGLDTEDKKHIESLHKKNYLRFS
jgi:tRNA1(Val) A37 N6-methylase TrmN6